MAPSPSNARHWKALEGNLDSMYQEAKHSFKRLRDSNPSDKTESYPEIHEKLRKENAKLSKENDSLRDYNKELCRKLREGNDEYMEKDKALKEAEFRIIALETDNATLDARLTTIQAAINSSDNGTKRRRILSTSMGTPSTYKLGQEPSQRSPTREFSQRLRDPESSRGRRSSYQMSTPVNSNVPIPSIETQHPDANTTPVRPQARAQGRAPQSRVPWNQPPTTTTRPQVRSNEPPFVHTPAPLIPRTQERPQERPQTLAQNQPNSSTVPQHDGYKSDLGYRTEDAPTHPPSSHPSRHIRTTPKYGKVVCHYCWTHHCKCVTPRGQSTCTICSGLGFTCTRAICLQYQEKGQCKRLEKCHGVHENPRGFTVVQEQ